MPSHPAAARDQPVLHRHRHVDVPRVTGYALGTWDAASVPNVGWVARLLNEYYPSTDEPKGLTDLNQKAAAVQAAIWFFSDRFVLATSDPLYPTVTEIVRSHHQSAGPLVSRRRPASPSPRRW